ncbi:MAG: hypothetical protein KJ067_11350 [Vicinamibacteria bacterium]|nr:hypothetical protein [Vicinamibacteria bacterium]
MRRWAMRLIQASWLALGLIHLLPAVALVQPGLVTRLYGVEAGDPLFVLLWHRAALFAGVLAGCVWAASRAEVRPFASALVASSMISFLLIFAAQGMPASLRAIAIGDVVGLPFLAVVTWNAWRPGPPSRP